MRQHFPHISCRLHLLILLRNVMRQNDLLAVRSHWINTSIVSHSLFISFLSRLILFPYAWFFLLSSLKYFVFLMICFQVYRENWEQKRFSAVQIHSIITWRSSCIWEGEPYFTWLTLSRRVFCSRFWAYWDLHCQSIAARNWL